MSDLHYSTSLEMTPKYREVQQRFFSQYFNHFFSGEYNKYISLGDLLQCGRKDEMEELFDKYIFQYDKPFIHIFGNHDTYNYPKQNVLEYSKQERFSYEETPEGILVFIDTTRDQDQENFSGVIDEEQLEWLERLFERYSKQPLYIFGHHPLFETTTGSYGYYGSINKENKLYELMEDHVPGGAYFCGHCHVHSIFVKDQWAYIQTAAVYFQPVFREVTIDNGRIETSILELQDEELLEDSEELRATIFRVFTDTPAEGTEKDRVYTRSLEKEIV